MGWGSGAYIMEIFIKALHGAMQDELARKAIYVDLINALEEQDWDTQDDCMGVDPAFDAALKELHPTWYED